MTSAARPHRGAIVMTATAPAPRAQIERTEHPQIIKGGGLGGQPRLDDQRISVLILLDYYESGASIDELSIRVEI
jgi:hypothetical protein